MKPARLVVALMAGSMVVGPAGTAGAATDAAALSRLSGPSPYASCTTPSGGEVLYPNAEVEPDVSANPARPANLIAVWQQDRWSGGGARGLMAGYTFNGG